MLTITYVSSAMRLFKTDELYKLLETSRDANRKHDITGMLLYNAGTFMQSIEGPDAAVNQLYTNIRKDPTHHMVMTLIEQPIEQRAFPNWSMGFNNLTGRERSSVEGFTNFLQEWQKRDELINNASHAHRLLHKFRENQLRGGYF